MTLPQKIDTYLQKGGTPITPDKLLGAFQAYNSMLSYADFQNIVKKLGHKCTVSKTNLQTQTQRGNDGKSTYDVALEFIKKNDSFTAAEIRGALYFNNRCFSSSCQVHTIARLLKEGKIEKIKRGVYKTIYT